MYPHFASSSRWTPAFSASYTPPASIATPTFSSTDQIPASGPVLLYLPKRPIGDVYAGGYGWGPYGSNPPIHRGPVGLTASGESEWAAHRDVWAPQSNNKRQRIDAEDRSDASNGSAGGSQQPGYLPSVRSTDATRRVRIGRGPEDHTLRFEPSFASFNEPQTWNGADSDIQSLAIRIQVAYNRPRMLRVVSSPCDSAFNLDEPGATSIRAIRLPGGPETGVFIARRDLARIIQTVIQTVTDKPFYIGAAASVLAQRSRPDFAVLAGQHWFPALIELDSTWAFEGCIQLHKFSEIEDVVTRVIGSRLSEEWSSIDVQMRERSKARFRLQSYCQVADGKGESFRPLSQPSSASSGTRYPIVFASRMNAFADVSTWSPEARTSRRCLVSVIADYQDTELCLTFTPLSPTVASTRSLGYILTLAILPGRGAESAPVPMFFSSEVSRLVCQLMKMGDGLRGDRQKIFLEFVERFGADKLDSRSDKAAMDMRWGPSDVQLETSVLKVDVFERFLIQAIAQQCTVVLEAYRAKTKAPAKSSEVSQKKATQSAAPPQIPPKENKKKKKQKQKKQAKEVTIQTIVISDDSELEADPVVVRVMSDDSDIEFLGFDVVDSGSSTTLPTGDMPTASSSHQAVVSSLPSSSLRVAGQLTPDDPVEQGQGSTLPVSSQSVTSANGGPVDFADIKIRMELLQRRPRASTHDPNLLQEMYAFVLQAQTRRENINESVQASVDDFGALADVADLKKELLALQTLAEETELGQTSADQEIADLEVQLAASRSRVMDLEAKIPPVREFRSTTVATVDASRSSSGTMTSLLPISSDLKSSRDDDSLLPPDFVISSPSVPTSSPPNPSDFTSLSQLQPLLPSSSHLSRCFSVTGFAGLVQQLEERADLHLARSDRRRAKRASGANSQSDAGNSAVAPQVSVT